VQVQDEGDNGAIQDEGDNGAIERR